LIFKKLELQGFKTFFDRTEVHFRPGINAVVGPNGCGKSNIADAIRWVLGEQSSKQLRGEKMEDLIFHGSESRHPLGMAEVSLTVETTGEELPAPYNKFTEVCVTRRLYRSGESEFFINNAACRMRDIRELFLDTGMNPKAYAVISQGSIGDIIKAHPEDRRIYIEEAAGIAKFKERKAAALRKLEATEQNLVRLGDLTAEVKRQLGSLQRQARKAERYHELKAQLEEAELQLLVHQHGTLQQRATAAEERLRALGDLGETLRTETAGNEAALETGALEAVELEKQLGALREEFYAQRALLEGIDQQLEAARARLLHLQQSVARGEAETARLGALVESHARDRERLEQELGELEGQLAERAALVEETAARLAGASATARGLREGLEAATARYRDGVRVEGEAQRRLAQLEARSEALERELARVGAELEALRAEDAQLAGREGELARELADARETQRANADAQSECAAAAALARQEVAEADAAHTTAREESVAATAHLASLSELERNLSGWPERFREELDRVLAHQDLNGGLRGLLADALHCPAEHENALEAVLGDRLKCLLVTSPEVGLEAARVIQEGAEVRGTFLPLHPRQRPAAPPPGGPGAARRMLDLVTVADDLRAVAEHLLRDVYVVEDLRTALELWREGGACTLVTAAGEVLWPDGAVTAGRLDPSRELLPLVRSIRETQAAAAGAEGRMREHGARVAEARARLQALEERARTLAGTGRAADAAISTLEKDLLLARQKRGAHAAQAERLEELATRAASERDGLASGLGEERELRNDLAAERARHEEQIASLEAEVTAALREERQLIERLGALQVEIAAGRERTAHLTTRREHLAGESGRAGERRAELALEMDASRAEESRTAAVVAELVDRRAVQVGTRDATEERLTAAQDRHREISGRARETEERLRQLRIRREELQGEIGALQVRLAEEQVRRGHLRERVVEIRSCAPDELWDEATRAALLERPVDELEARQRELAAQIQALGPVNLAALGDQQELQERLESQKRQHADLEQADRDLRQAIQKINATSREKFLETFEKVNEKFQESFPMLLENGHALLRLTEGDDPLDAGVEILAQPAGKKLKHISLLSGGEQALTAIALLLAIFMVKPSPFCLLDEVDAPLDEANVGRFLRVLRRSINGSQLVMITHNKRTMESANHLVGVTMADPGVSRLISVQLRETAAQAS
jgi:chromosome segregation protein